MTREELGSKPYFHIIRLYSEPDYNRASVSPPEKGGASVTHVATPPLQPRLFFGVGPLFNPQLKGGPKSPVRNGDLLP